MGLRAHDQAEDEFGSLAREAAPWLPTPIGIRNPSAQSGWPAPRVEHPFQVPRFTGRQSAASARWRGRLFWLYVKLRSPYAGLPPSRMA
jgi:hypothetical protein